MLSRERIQVTLKAGKTWRADGKAGSLRLVGINTGAGDLHFRAGIIVAKASAPIVSLNRTGRRNDSIWDDTRLPTYEGTKARLDSLIAAEPDFATWLKLHSVSSSGDVVEDLKAAYIAQKTQERNNKNVLLYQAELRSKLAEYEYLKAEMNRLIGDDPDFGVWLKDTFPKHVILNGAVGRRTEAESYSRRYYRQAATSPHGCDSSIWTGWPISSYEPCEWTSIDTHLWSHWEVAAPL